MGDTLAKCRIRGAEVSGASELLSPMARRKPIALAKVWAGNGKHPTAFIFAKPDHRVAGARIDVTNAGLATKHEARDAIEALLAGKPVAVENTPAVGCSTK